ncbi:MAG: methyltransferase domain-containing protein [Pseudomonadota bacterium]
MSHQSEYDDSMVRMLGLIWGEGYMAPGGPGNVAKILRNIPSYGKCILDIGCGVGGPAFEMATRHGAEVVGVDLEAALVQRAQQAAEERNLLHRCQFQLVAPGPLPFADQSFDVVVSSGAVTQTPDKAALFLEIFRVLKPGGWFSCYEWLGTGKDDSPDMRYWIQTEGLTYEMRTMDEYHSLLHAAHYDSISVVDASDWYQREAQREYDVLKGDMYPELVATLGREDADHFVENWRAMIVVINKGEMKQAYMRGRRPD